MVSQIVSYIDDIFHMCKLVPRVAYHLVAISKSEANYFDVVTTHRELRNMKGVFLLFQMSTLAQGHYSTVEKDKQIMADLAL